MIQIRQRLKLARNGLVGQFRNLPAFFTDGKNHGFPAIAFGMTARHKGIETLQPMHKAELQQLVESPVHLQRCPYAVFTQTIQDCVGTQGPFGIRQGVIDKLLILGQCAMFR